MKESENIKLEGGNDLARLWTCTEYNIDVDQTPENQSFNDSDSVQTEVTGNLSSTNSSSSESNLLMPTMPDLNELTCRRSGQLRKPPDFYDPSAASTIKSESPKSKIVCLQ